MSPCRFITEPEYREVHKTMRIETIDHAATGSHWDSMADVDAWLESELEQMAAALRILREEASWGDMASVELEEGQDITDAVSTWFLDVSTSTWDTDPRELCRVELVTGTGGPHTELVGIYSTSGELVRVEGHQYWSGHREAFTTDREALGVFEDFRSAFVYVDGID